MGTAEMSKIFIKKIEKMQLVIFRPALVTLHLQVDSHFLLHFFNELFIRIGKKYK